MSYGQQMVPGYDTIFTLPSHPTTFSSTFNQPSSIHLLNYPYNSSHVMSDSLHSFMLPSNYSKFNSHMGDLRISHSTNSHQQPIINPHKYFLTRMEENCPTHLTKTKRTKRLKAGRKAQSNQRLLFTLNSFYWPESNYGSTVYIHYRTSETLLLGIIHKISNVNLYCIDTELDKPTRLNPHSTPALIQVQAIHDMNYSTVILIEVQHLPSSSSSLFHSIQQLCRMIFSSNNKIIAWGDVKKKLLPFTLFNLLDLSHICYVAGCRLRNLFILDDKNHN